MSVKRFGREDCPANSAMARHLHAEGYIALVLAGGYVEAGDEGRFHVGPGEALLHARFDAHLDRFGRRGAVVLNLPLPASAPAFPKARVEDPDRVARIALADPWSAAELLLSQARPLGRSEQDWPDLLASALREHPRVEIGEWARSHGLAPATVSRAFAQLFGTSPVRYALHLRARRAWRAIDTSSARLADIAADTGFADQAHMSRAVTALTGVPPGRWRRQKRSRRP